ncbi:MAG TPA: heparan-alpha-glucosaminide N-acetyltransferase domain-containing protein [Vicinamibacterales bacterium]|nr:heparan-alpha-glucosaminide N-acetyltransferase domain-containing protein [Vicinamibacterales bacterium]
MRRAYIDWARGIAVLLMIEAHTFDSWTRVADRQSVAWRNFVILAGFAAPLFLWLAGVAVVLAATRAEQRDGSRLKATESVVRRGLEIFLLAFVFRIQAYLLSPGSPALTIFRVDILNIMGPSIAASGIVWGLCSTSAQRVAAFSIVATVICFATPFAYSTPAFGRLPAIAQWYLRHSGEYTTFAALPWVEFVFAGAATGALIVAARGEAAEGIAHAALALAGAALVVVGFYAAEQPRVFPGATFWTTSPTWLAIRLGIMMTALAALGQLEKNSLRAFVSSWLHPLARFGRSSLFVYWIHVELAYGYASYYWWKALPLWGTVAAYVVFCVAMYGALVLRDRLVAAWRARPKILAIPVAPQA